MMTTTVKAVNSKYKNSIYREIRCGLDPEKLVAYETFFRRYAKDKVIIEIGCGPGILSYIAGRYGAKKVYAYEYNLKSYNLAKELLKDLDNVEVILTKDFANESSIPTADIIIHEVLGHGVEDENIIKICKAVHKSGQIDKMYPKFYDYWYVDMPSEEEFHVKPYVYEEEHFLEYAVEFHKKLKAHMPDVEEWDFNVATNRNLYPYITKEEGTRFKTWSMLDPIETWGYYPDGIFSRVHRGEIALCWTAYLDHHISFSNSFRRGNNWIPVFNSLLVKRLTNQIRFEPPIRNNYNREEWAKYVSI